VLWLACAAGVAACAPAPPPAERTPGGAAPPPSADTGREFGVTHHAVLSGTVTSASGVALDSVTVAVRHPADPSQGSMRQTETVTGADGRFTLPAQMFVGGERDGQTVRVGVVVRAFGLASKYRGSGDAVPTDSATVWVQMVPVAHTPPVAPVRLTLRVPGR